MAYNAIHLSDHSLKATHTQLISSQNRCHSSSISSLNNANVDSSTKLVISLSCPEVSGDVPHSDKHDKHVEVSPKMSSRFEWCDASFSSFSSDGMRDVPQWLKTLRLHKYANLFSNISYERMMALSEQELESLNVTKGARHKLIVSINKLNNRANVLKALYTDLCYEGVCCVRQTLVELKNILITPIKRSSNRSQRNHSYNNVSNSNSINNNNNPSNNNNNNNNEDLFLLIANNSNGDNEDRNMANNSIVKTNCDNYLNVSDDDLPEIITRLLSKVYVTINECSSVDEDCINMYNNIVDKCLVHDAFTLSQKNRIHKLKQPVHKTWTTHCSHRRVVDYAHSRRKTSSQTFHHQFQPHSQIYRTHSAPVSRSHLSQTETHSHSKYECEQQLNDIEKLCIRMTEQALGLSDGGLLNQDF